MNAKIDVLKIDKNMAVEYDDKNSLIWLNANQKPFKTVGFYWFEQDKVYRRFPVNPDPILPENVEALCNHTAGGQVKFKTDSCRIAVKVKLRDLVAMDNMTAISHSGFDLYSSDSNCQAFIGVTRFGVNEQEYVYEFNRLKTPGVKDFTLNFPLYNGVEELAIGLEENASLDIPTPFADDRPIVIYGTSIVHGACASRPGMCYSNILSRKLNRPFINLGFSGSGKGEPEVAEHIARIENPAMFIIDYEANCVSVEKLAETLPEFINILRASHSETPIVVVSKIPYPQELFDKKERDFRENCKMVQIKTVECFQAAGDKNIYFIDGNCFLGEDFWECSGDSGHPSNLGFYRMAEYLLPEIERILK